MGKQVTALLTTLLVICTVRAEYLWYAVSGEEDGFADVASRLEAYEDTGTITDSDTVYAQVIAVKGDTTTVLGSQGFRSEWVTSPASVSLSALGDDAAAYSYYIEIRSTQVSKAIGFSTRVSYASMEGSITDSLTSIPTVNAWHGSGYSVEPEPTSATLMLLGAAVLALRRKRRIA